MTYSLTCKAANCIRLFGVVCYVGCVMLGIRYNFSLFVCSCQWQIQRMMIRLCEHDKYGNMFPLPQPNHLLADEFVLSVITLLTRVGG